MSSMFVQYDIRPGALVLSDDTAELVRKGGVIGARITREIEHNVKLLSASLGRLRVIGRDGREIPQFAAN